MKIERLLIYWYTFDVQGSGGHYFGLNEVIWCNGGVQSLEGLFAGIERFRFERTWGLIESSGFSVLVFSQVTGEWTGSLPNSSEPCSVQMQWNFVGINSYTGMGTWLGLWLGPWWCMLCQFLGVQNWIRLVMSKGRRHGAYTE